MCRLLALLLPLFYCCVCLSQGRLVPVGLGYSSTSVNTAIFRTNAIVTADSTQYIAYYDGEGYVTLGKRTLGSDHWDLQRTSYRGHVEDGHNVISLAIDGDGYLHVAFDHHGSALHYCRGVAPGALELSPLQPMVGVDEGDVTYPEFYRLPSGDLLFVYRSGSSGDGNMVMNYYDSATQQWSRRQSCLLSGEQQRNAYWQMYVDRRGVVYLSWCWRETWLVETNHDLCFAVSYDAGQTWQTSYGERYALPITASTAEYAWHIPQGSELMNQTSMCADEQGRVYIATYWCTDDSGIPQYRLVWHDGHTWQMTPVSQRQTPFSLAGGGTKRVPIARPRVLAQGDAVWLITRDSEYDDVVMTYHTNALSRGTWDVECLTTFPVDAWEPMVDLPLWLDTGAIHLFVERTRQGDGEVIIPAEPEMVYVLEMETN